VSPRQEPVRSLSIMVLNILSLFTHPDLPCMHQVAWVQVSFCLVPELSVNAQSSHPSPYFFFSGTACLLFRVVGRRKNGHPYYGQRWGLEKQ